jgi:lysine-N-methylase
MKLQVLPDENFSCRSCGNCCRDWHVELDAREVERVRTLSWPTADPLVGANVLLQHGGRTYLAHKANGACVFLNESNGLCRIHETFGGDVKPLGCRLYPFQIVPTFAGQASVTARFDCPQVRRNAGASHADELPQLRRYASAMTLPPPFDEATRCGLQREQIEAVCDFAGALMNGFARNDQRTLFLAYLCDWLATVPTADLDRPTLAAAFAELRGQVEASAGPAAPPSARPGLLHRVAFRTLLTLYLRRDEDVLNGRATRAGRMRSMLAIVLGFGNLRGLGVSHPPGKLRRARLFHDDIAVGDADLFALHWRMVRTKLASQQFMGGANRGRDFLTGLRSLAMLYPLVAAVAKSRAGNRGATAVDESDVDHAVAAIEHSFGRAAVLAMPFARSLERLLQDRAAFTRLVRTV